MCTCLPVHSCFQTLIFTLLCCRSKLSKHKSYRVTDVIRRAAVYDPAEAARLAAERDSRSKPTAVDAAQVCVCGGMCGEGSQVDMSQVEEMREIKKKLTYLSRTL